MRPGAWIRAVREEARRLQALGGAGRDRAMCGQRCQPRRELSRSQKVPCVLTTLLLCTRLCPERMLTPKDPGGIAKVPRAFVGPTVPRPPQPRPTAPPVG